jgi:hypothetical protein
MAKKKISSSDLAWVFLEGLRSFDDCAAGISVAIVPSRYGWTAVANKTKAQRPGCAARIVKIQKQLRDVYVLGKD